MSELDKTRKEIDDIEEKYDELRESLWKQYMSKKFGEKAEKKQSDPVIVDNFGQYQKLVDNLKTLSGLPEVDFSDMKIAYYVRTVMNEARRAIVDLEAYKNSLKLYFVLFSKKEGLQWTCHGGYIFAKDGKDIGPLLSIRYGTEINVRTIEKIDILEGTVLYGERWKNF